MQQRAVRRLELRSALARAVELEELELAYQPVVELQARRTTGVEALLRWRTPEGEPISPAEFFPVAEASGLIVPLGGWVLERACAYIAPLGDLGVGVNVSAVQLRAGDFPHRVAAALERSGLAPDRLVIELTESAATDDVATIPLVAEGVETEEQLVALRALGCRYAQGYHLGRPGRLAAVAVDGRPRSLR